MSTSIHRVCQDKIDLPEFNLPCTFHGKIDVISAMPLAKYHKRRKIPITIVVISRNKDELNVNRRYLRLYIREESIRCIKGSGNALIDHISQNENDHRIQAAVFRNVSAEMCDPGCILRKSVLFYMQIRNKQKSHSLCPLQSFVLIISQFFPTTKPWTKQRPELHSFFPASITSFSLRKAPFSAIVI